MVAVVTQIGNNWYFATEQFLRNICDRRLLTFNHIEIQNPIVIIADEDEQRQQIYVDGKLFAYIPSSEIHI